MASSASRLKRDLGGLLAKLRAQTTLRAQDVWPHLGRAQSTLSRIENGITAPSRDDLEIFRRLYRPSDEAWAEVIEAWNEVQADKKRLKLPAKVAISDSFRRLLKSERSAKTVITYQPLAIPGLLQIEAYARHIEQALGDQGPEAANLVAVRIWRQDRINRGELELHAYLDEAVIRRARGLGAEGVAQLEHLVEMAARPNVTICVVPFSSGVHGAMTGPITLLEFERKADAAEVYLEFPGGGAWAPEDEVPRYRSMLDSVVGKARSAEESANLIAQVARTRTR